MEGENLARPVLFLNGSLCPRSLLREHSCCYGCGRKVLRGRSREGKATWPGFDSLSSLQSGELPTERKENDTRRCRSLRLNSEKGRPETEGHLRHFKCAVEDARVKSPDRQSWAMKRSLKAEVRHTLRWMSSALEKRLGSRTPVKGLIIPLWTHYTITGRW